MIATQTDQLIGTVKVGDDKEIVVKLTEVDGVQWLNVRERILSSNVLGRGVLIPVQGITAFKHVIQRVPEPVHTDPVDLCTACT